MERPRFLRPQSKILLPTVELQSLYRDLKFVEKPEEAQAPYRGERELWARLQSGETWRIHLDQMHQIEADTHEKRHIRPLKNKLKNKVVSGRLEEKQRTALYFIHANWKELVGLFYTTEPAGHFTPVAFSQVMTEEFPRNTLDFVGIGPDGKVFLMLGVSQGRNNNQELERQHAVLLKEHRLRNEDVVTRLVSFIDYQKKDGERESKGLLRIVSRVFNGASLEG